MKPFTIAHSIDSYDAYMMAPIALGWIKSKDLDIKFVRKDLELLNSEAISGIYDVTAISFGTYPKIMNKYDLLTAGSSIQESIGPLVISNAPISNNDIVKTIVAIPGLGTSAHMVMNKWMPNLNTEIVPFDQIMLDVAYGRYQAGLLIRESQLIYQDFGLNLIQDLGVWWKNYCDLPLPMGGNAILKNLDPKIKRSFAKLMRRSVFVATSRHTESLMYAQSFNRGVDNNTVGRYISAWVNDFSINVGLIGKLAVAKLIGFDANWING